MHDYKQRLTRLGMVLLFSVLAVSTLDAVQEKDAPTHWYKGNLHTHSLWSDGNDFPEMITKWYVDHDYQFLALTDHNILSDREKWMSIEAIAKRGGKDAVKKCQAAYGKKWTEIRTKESGKQEVRLKKLSEYRGKFERPGEFMLMNGEEISDQVDGFPVHMNATNLVHMIRPASGKTVREAMTSNLRSAIEQSEKENRDIIVHLNHPNFGWAVTAEDLAFVTLEKFFEVYNGHPGVNQMGDKDHPTVERLWDIANTIRIDQLNAAPLFGLGTDDCHYYHGRPGSQPGRGWIMVKATELNPKTIVAAINKGDFYSSSGVELNEVAFDQSRQQLRVDIKAIAGETYTTQFIGTLKDYDRANHPRVSVLPKRAGKPLRLTRVYSEDVGKVLATVKGPSATYQMTGDELYVRAVVISSAAHPNPSINEQKQKAWTQPVGWRVGE